MPTSTAATISAGRRKRQSGLHRSLRASIKWAAALGYEILAVRLAAELERLEEFESHTPPVKEV